MVEKGTKMPGAVTETKNRQGELNRLLPSIISVTKERYPGEEISKTIARQKVYEALEKRLNLKNGTTLAEGGADCANRFGKIKSTFTFDGHRPFNEKEKEKHNAIGLKENEIEKKVIAVRGKERIAAKKIWEVERRIEVRLFAKIFKEYLEVECGGHKEDKMGRIYMVGNSIMFDANTGHYRRIYEEM